MLGFVPGNYIPSHALCLDTRQNHHIKPTEEDLHKTLYEFKEANLDQPSLESEIFHKVWKIINWLDVDDISLLHAQQVFRLVFVGHFPLYICLPMMNGLGFFERKKKLKSFVFFYFCCHL